MVPQRTVSFKCRPLGTCIGLHSDEIYWRTSRGLYWESKKYKLKRSYVRWSSIFSCITVKWGIVQSRSHGSLSSFLEGEIDCSRCSDRGDSAKRCEQKKITTWGTGSFTAYIFSRSLSPLSERLEQSEIGKVGTIYVPIHELSTRLGNASPQHKPLTLGCFTRLVCRTLSSF